eukprot:g11225.t1
MGEIPRTSDVSRPEEVSLVVETTPLNDVSSREENGLRVKMLDQIVTCLEMKKPSWQKARILHLSTQLEDSMFNSRESLADYGDVSTLPAKINHHCLLLATRKTATSTTKAPPLDAAGGVCSFAATPVSRRAFTYRSAHVKVPTNGSISMSGPPSGSGSFSQPAPRDPAASSGGTGTAAPHAVGVGSSWIGAGHTLSVDVGVGGGRRASVGHQYDGAGKRRSVQGGGGSNGPRSTCYSTLLPPAASCMITATEGSRRDAPHSSHGETTEDDTNDDSVDGDGDEDGDYMHDERLKVPEAAASASGPGPMPSTPLSWTPKAVSPAPLHEEEKEVTEQAHVEAVIAAASLGNDTAWNAEVRGGEPGARQLLEGGYKPRIQQRSKTTEAEVRQHALRLLQCRLLLLTHASTCSKEGGSCQLAPLCDSVRQLLHHLQSCRDEKSCEFPHCKSSKAVLQHKHLCTDSACRLCCSVKDLSQKCFWANARHLHKRRLEESHELRRKKRQSEGKAVAPPRKLQAEKAKGREVCSGLDEAGNDLGDISLGFFLRQAKAVKERKIGKAQENDGSDDGATAGANSATPSTGASTAQAQGGTTLTPTPTPSAGSKRSHANVAVAKGGDSAMPKEMGSSPPAAARTQEQMQTQRHTRGDPAPAPTPAPTPAGLGSPSAASSGLPAFPSPVSSPRLRRSSSSSVSWSALLAHQLLPRRGCRSPRAQAQFSAVEMQAPEAEGSAATNGAAVDAEDVSGGGPEACSVGASSGGNGGSGGGGRQSGKRAAERAGGLTVVIPPVGSGAVVGHLRSPSEIMLDDIAESLADTTRKPSFARMQSVQAFLDDHVELRASASFGDVSAMVEHWMSLEDNNYADNLEDENGMDAFSF